MTETGVARSVSGRLCERSNATTAALNQQVSRNRDRFPEDFAYQPTQKEFTSLMSQIAISNANANGIPVSDFDAGSVEDALTPVDVMAGHVGVQEEPCHSPILRRLSACSANRAFSHRVRPARSASHAARSVAVISIGATRSMAAIVRAISSADIIPASS